MAKDKRTYWEKLKDPRWQKKRLDVMNRDGFACRHCGSKRKTLNVHHLFYVFDCDPWDYEEKELITLCASCHLAEQQFRDLFTATVQKLLINGKSYADLEYTLVRGFNLTNDDRKKQPQVTCDGESS